MSNITAEVYRLEDELSRALRSVELEPKWSHVANVLTAIFGESSEGLKNYNNSYPCKFVVKSPDFVFEFCFAQMETFASVKLVTYDIKLRNEPPETPPGVDFLDRAVVYRAGIYETFTQEGPWTAVIRALADGVATKGGAAVAAMNAASAVSKLAANSSFEQYKQNWRSHGAGLT